MAVKVAQKTGTGTTSLATSYQTGYTPASGDLIRISVTSTASSTTIPTIGTPTGFTKMGTNSGTGTLVAEITVVFGRWANGTSSDNAPTITATGAAGSIWETAGFTGLDSTAALPLQPSAGFSGSAGSSATAFTGNSITTSIANEFVMSILGGRAGTPLTAVTWSGTTADLAITTSGNSSMATASTTVTTSGTVTNPSATGSGGNGLKPIYGILSFGFTPSTGGGGGGGTTNAAAILLSV